MKFEKWNISEYRPAYAHILEAAGYPSLISALLSARGVTAETEAHALTCCSMDDLENPALMLGMDKAVKRLSKAIRRKEHIAVFGDYDVDGITSTCLLVDWLRSKGLSDCEIYIPDRESDGYGLNNKALDCLHSMGVTLTITVDCGITAVNEAIHASEMGMELIITDHHECKSELPRAEAVVDPKLPYCPYPYKSLAGVGVAFKLICAMEGPEATEALLNQYGDLVAAGTIADVMPVTGENKIFIQYGIDLLREKPRPGFSALMDAARVNRSRISPTTVSFTLAPRLNAAGRMGNAGLSVDLLLEKDYLTASKLASRLCDMNSERQRIEKEIYSQAICQLKNSNYTGNSPIVLASEGWHQGVIGIVASRLSEHYSVPAVMICLKDGFGKGSCRSPRGFNIFEALEKTSDILDGFGGHEMAAGLTISEKNISEFRKRLSILYNSSEISCENSGLNIDLCIFRSDLISFENVKALTALEPYGPGNRVPVFFMPGAKLCNLIPIGGGKHTKLSVSKWGTSYDCIYFSHSADELGVTEGSEVDIAFSLHINDFRGESHVQLQIEDIRPSEYSDGTKERLNTFLSGGGITPEDACAVLPERADFIRLWRKLEHNIPFDGEDCKIYVCLEVLNELGLIKLAGSDGRVSITPIKTGEKANLMSSTILQRLVEAVQK